MGRKLATLFFLFCLGAAPAVFAVGLGNIETESQLNEPLDVRIPLIATTEADVNNVKVSLASPEAFDRAGIERPFHLSRLRFEVVPDGAGGLEVAVTTEQPVKEPFLDFLVEVAWPEGQLVRQYAVLLNPPTYANDTGAAAVAAPSASSGAAVSGQSASTASTSAGAAGTATTAPAPDGPTVPRSDGDVRPAPTRPATYGAVQANETLWDIAQQVRAGTDATVNQTMLALLRANPDAFIENNINRLRRGAILRVPPESDLLALNAAEATREVREQMAAWQASRTVAAGGANGDAPASESAQASTSAEEGSGSGAGVAAEGRLEVVAPEASEGQQATTSVDQADSDASGTAASGRVVLLEEQNASLESENADLRRQVASLKEDLARMERMVNVQMEQSLSGTGDGAAGSASSQGTESPSDEAPAEETVAAEVSSGADEAPVADQPATGESEATAQTVEEPQAASAAPEEQAPVADEPAPVEPAPRPQPSLMDQLLGNMTVLAGGALVVLLLLLMAVRIARRRREGDDADDFGDEAPVMAGATAGGGAAAFDDDAMAQGAAADDAIDEADRLRVSGDLAGAQDVLDSALGEDTDNRELRFKLLEVLSERDDRAGFEAEAQVLHTQIDSESDPLWRRVVAMGRAIAPEHPLFEVADAGGVDHEARDAAPEAGVASDGDDSFDLTDETFDLDPNEVSDSAQDDDAVPMDDVADATDPVTDATSFDLDFDLDDEESGEEPAEIGADAEENPSETEVREVVDTDDGETSDLDFDLDFSLDDEPAAEAGEPDSIPEKKGGAIAGDGGMDFDLSDFERGGESRWDAGRSTAQGSENDGLDFDGFSLDDAGDRDDEEADRSAADDAAEHDDGADEGEAFDEVETKLDLARAYLDMGDSDGARGLLEEVAAEGDDSQKEEAEKLLASAG